MNTAIITSDRNPLATNGLPFSHLMFEGRDSAAGTEVARVPGNTTRPFAHEFYIPIENPKEALPFSLDDVQYNPETQMNDLPYGMAMGFTISITWTGLEGDDCDADPL